jgi:REP element-mobilizing transposase RayT
MSIRRQPLINKEIYHIYNRGVDKRDIFNDKNDIYRFLESIKEFNRLEKIESLANLRKFKQIGAKPLSGEKLVEIIAYCLNPNHFHFILRQSVDNGITKYMHKILGGYTSYFNIKNSRSGSLFQGTFKSQLIGNENYFNKIIGYVNKNYQVHDIPENKKDLIFASDYEYENSNFKIISKTEGEKVLEIFGGTLGFKNHSDEIISIIRKERGKISLIEEENLPDRG